MELDVLWLNSCGFELYGCSPKQYKTYASIMLYNAVWRSQCGEVSEVVFSTDYLCNYALVITGSRLQMCSQTIAQVRSDRTIDDDLMRLAE